jgi:hypothetical protein
MKKIISIFIVATFLISCNKDIKKECGHVVSIKTEQPVGSDTITITLSVQYTDLQRDWVIKEDGRKYPPDYWKQLYGNDAYICIEREK